MLSGKLEATEGLQSGNLKTLSPQNQIQFDQNDMMCVLHSAETSDGGDGVAETATPFTLLQDTLPSTWFTIVPE